MDANGCPIVASLLSATATASTSGPAGGPALAVDGNLATRWESAIGVDPSWIVLDLGANYALSEVIIHWEAANAASYEIQGSADNSNWTPLFSRVRRCVWRAHGYCQPVWALIAMCACMASLATVTYGYSIWEMEVYGSPASDLDGDGVDDSLDLCPGTPPGSSVDANGCVFNDADNDGVEDTLDLCPGTPPATPVDANGCAVIIPVNEVSSINDILAGGEGSSQPGFTLYVFDNDLVQQAVTVMTAVLQTGRLYWSPMAAPPAYLTWQR